MGHLYMLRIVIRVQKKWRPRQDKADLMVGNVEKVKVERIGTVKLKQESDFCFELADIVYLP